MGTNLAAGELGIEQRARAVRPVTSEEVRRARLRVAERAESPEDLALLLEALGIGDPLKVRVDDGLVPARPGTKWVA